MLVLFMLVLTSFSERVLFGINFISWLCLFDLISPPAFILSATETKHKLMLSFESLLSLWTNPDPVLASPRNRATVLAHDSSHASDWLWFWGSANRSEWPRGTETAWSFLPAISPSAPFQSAVKLIYSAPHFYISKDYFPSSKVWKSLFSPVSLQQLLKGQFTWNY